MIRTRQKTVRKNQPMTGTGRRRRRQKPTLGQKVRRWLMVTVLAALCVIGVWEFDRVESVAMSLTTVQHVTIVGLKELERTDILAKLNLLPETSLFHIQADSIIADLKSLPWVRNAAVERIFPHTLAIRIDEREPAAIWQSKNVRYVLDSQAAVLSTVTHDEFSGLPMVMGIPEDFVRSANDDIRKHIRDGIRVGSFLSREFDGVPTIYVDHPSMIVADTQDLRFQFQDAIEVQWQRFQVLYPSIETQITSEATEIDLRYSGKVILRKRE